VVQLQVAREEAEVAADALWQAGASAVEEAAGIEGQVRLTADVAAGEVAGLGRRWAVTPVEVDEDRDLDAWREHATATRAGIHVVLCPAWQPLPPAAPDDVLVVLDPGRAFGSGSHPATRLAVAAVEAWLAPGDRVLDVGCGSGVLAIVALRLGAEAAVGIDVDPAALFATEANAEANGVADRLAVRQAGLGEPVRGVSPGQTDLVVANIGVRVLGEQAAPLQELVRPGGVVVLSGLLDGQADAVVARFDGCQELERRHEGGWAAPVLRRER
jgi:ribosomal protein L11 methyltransferase